MTTRAPHVLREYALLADGERGALIGPSGELAWMCAPRWHSDAVFASLIGGGGSYRVSPVDRFVWGGQYERRTLIWRSRWVTDDGVVDCREALAFPGDEHRAVLLRRVIATQGEGRVAVRLDPTENFGLAGGIGLARRDRPHREPNGWAGRSGRLRWRWTGVPEATPTDEGLTAVLRIAQGQHRDLVLELADQPLDDNPVDPDNAWAATVNSWHGAVPELAASVAPRDAEHAYAVMRGLTANTGGMVAATTLGLPERASQGRNYDYRYVWIRDQCFAGQAVAAAGDYPLLDDAVGFVAARLLDAGPNLAPAYTVDSEPVPTERELSLPGYPGGKPVVGNQVRGQFQLDAFGEALGLFAAAGRLGRLDNDARAAMDVAVSAIAKRWREADAGIWELEPARWAHSRLAAAAGLRSAAGYLAEAGAARGTAADWAALADTLVADTADCRHPSGRWQRAPHDPRVDAALVLPALRGAVPPEDPRAKATLRAVCAELTDDGYVYRFRHDHRALGEAEGAFTLCGFLLALACHQAGDRVGAASWFERNRAACGPPGLLAEEYDVAQRQLRGNLPQAFVHAALLEAAHVLAD